ncbi:hypothetical protein QTP70_015228 [Hemibagrus guttatus]|uniref:Uncharacterized protein n=1 Tax=Hemibagrus guttatus TaxID=175788 RepID=A0AAE0V2B2_9TELE|nr:hypothetical protein QTP70_015228 [Hemibagrus guttatus]
MSRVNVHWSRVWMMIELKISTVMLTIIQSIRTQKVLHKDHGNVII